MITVTKNKENNRLNIQFSGAKFYDILQFVKYYKCRFIPETKSWESTDELKDIPKFLNEIKKLDDSIKIDDVIYDNKPKIEPIKDTTDYTDPNIKSWRIKLYEHQKGDVNFLLSHPKCLLANEMGCGKTISLVGGAIKLYELDQIKKVLIVCPSPIIPEWLNTINNHTNFKCTDVRKDRIYNTKTMFNITSIDMVYNDFMKMTDKNAANRKINNNDIAKYDLLIIDEAHKCANKNLRFKALRSIARKIPRCWLASGTPLQNKLQEVYNLFTAFISKDLITWPYFTNHFCEKGGFMGKEIIGYKNLDEFSKLISPFVRRVTKKSLGDIFVKKYEIRHWLTMSKDETKFYENVKDQVIELESDPLKEKKIRIAEELVLVNYLKQICNSLYEIDETKKVSSKINKIEELLKEWNNEKVIIYSFYKKTSQLLYDTLSKNYNCYIYNGNNSKKLDQAKQWFQEPNNNVFIMSKVGTEGLNFNFCKKMIFLSLDYNPAILQQISDRIHRINSKEDVEIHYLIHEKTYEEHIMQIVDSKRNLQDSVINCLSVIGKNERDIILDNI